MNMKVVIARCELRLSDTLWQLGMNSQTAEAHGNRNIIVQASGSGHTINVDGFAHLTLISPSRNKVRMPVRVLDLLNPGARAVPLIGRDQDKGDLREWLSSEHAISVRTITGPGGSGKTRLALEMMLEVAGDAANSWDAGFLSHAEARRFVAAQNLSSWGWQRDTLIVIDYAASLAPELRVILSELENSEYASGNPRLRVLLLERHASTETAWYSSLVSGDWQSDAVRALFDPWEPVKLRPVQGLADRLGILRATLERAASLGSIPIPFLPSPGQDVAFERRLMDPRWSDPLMLMMAALTALDTGIATALSLSRPEIAGRVAEHELARIRKFAPKQEWHAGDFLVQLAAFVTLCGGLSRQEALSAAANESSALGLQYPNGYGAAVSDLHNALPALDGAVEPVRPDLIGEAFLLKAWIAGPPPGYLARALTFAQKTVINVFVRTAQDFAEDRDPRPLQWLDELLSHAGDARLLSAVNDALPFETVCLREFALRVVTALTPLTESAELCRLLTHLSNRQSDLGQREQALASIQEAARLYRDLAAARPDAFQAHLASSLNNLSNRQSDLGQREQALASIEEAVRICRDLVAARPDAFRPDLARSLHNLSNQQSDLGQREQALASIEEAVRLYRDLATAHPDAFRPDLARSLNNLSNRQSDLGQREQALANIEEAVRICRDLAAARPDAFRPNLASSLNNLSSQQRDLGQREQALASSEEAVRLYRDLATAHPDAFRPDLARSLNNLSNRQSDLGQREQALASIEEAVRFYRDLAAARPDAFRPDLASSLNNLSNRQSGLGQREQALASIEEAVRLYRDLATAHPDAFWPDLARSLSNLSNRQNDLGQREQALASGEEAVLIYRDLAAARPDAFQPDLASSLNNVSVRQSALGQREQALVSGEEAVRIRRDLAAACPAAFRPDLALSLNNLSNQQSALGQREQALASIEEAVRLYRDLAAKNLAFEPELARSLGVLAGCCSASDNPERAIRSVTEALVRLRSDFLAFPAVFAALAGTLLNYYRAYAESLGHEPNWEILEPYVQYFNRPKPSEE
jgi:hypothetical protein